MQLITQSFTFALSCTILLVSSSRNGILAERSNSQPSRNDALSELFGTIDKDGDGQIQPSEALQYIGASFDEQDISVTPANAAQQMSENLDGSDADATISREEVETHLKRKLLKGNRLAEWLKHAALMPQYVEAFKINSITSLDFPSLIANSGELLESELGVKSRLHREKLIRAMKLIILGIGTPPSQPELFEASAIQCNAVALNWQVPSFLGQPPMHKYKLERLRLTDIEKGAVAQLLWRLVSDTLDDESVSYLDSGLEAGSYRYRLTAWNTLGWSKIVESMEVSTALLSLPCPPGKCWRQGNCVERSAGEMSSLYIPKTLISAWKLVCSLAGVLVLGYGVLVFITGKGSGLFRKDTGFGSIQEIPSQYQPGSPSNADAHPLQQGYLQYESPDRDTQSIRRTASYQAVTHTEPEQLAAKSHLPRATSEQLAAESELAQPAQLSTDLCQTCNSWRQAQGPSPIKTACSPPGHSEVSVPGDLASYRRQSLQQSKESTIQNNGLHLGLSSSAQEVVWLDSEGQETRAPPALDIPPSPRGIGRHGCAFPGCEKGLHPIFNPKSAMTSHYCSICQSVFCQRHTQYSPHGKLGSCGMESKCVCQLCFEDLPKITQERLERTNKLQQKTRKDLAVQNSGGSGSSKDKEGRRRLLSGKYGSGHSLASSADYVAGISKPASVGQESQERSAAQHWTKLRTAFQAVLLFQGAGNDRRRRGSQDSESNLLKEKYARKTQ